MTIEDDRLRFGFDVALADMDADARLDVVVAFSFAVEVWSVDRDRSVRRISTQEVGSGPIRVATVDLDGDGVNDVVTANGRVSGGNISILRNDGTGSLGLPTNRFVAEHLRTLVIADFDGDGDHDVAVGAKGGVAVIAGRGDGTFGQGTPRVIPRSSVVDLDVADLDRDGDVDLVAFVQRGSNIVFLLNDGRGEFRPGPRYSTAGGTNRGAVDDVTGDGFEDFVTVDSIFFNVLASRVAFGTSGFLALYMGDPTDVALLDADNDGDLDVFATGLDYSTLFRNNSSHPQDFEGTGIAGLSALAGVSRIAIADNGRQ